MSCLLSRGTVDANGLVGGIVDNEVDGNGIGVRGRIVRLVTSTPECAVMQQHRVREEFGHYQFRM